MSMGTACKCRPRNLVVITRRGNYSAFSGYRFTPSDYSDVQCVTCGQRWRTKAGYVNEFPDGPSTQRESKPLTLLYDRVTCPVMKDGKHIPRDADPARCRECGFFIPKADDIQVPPLTSPVEVTAVIFYTDDEKGNDNG